MLRVSRIFIREHLLTSLSPIIVASNPLFSTAAAAANCLNVSPHKINNDTDFEPFFRLCTNVQTLHRVHGLLVVSGRLKRIFDATRLFNLYAHLGVVSSSCLIFNKMPKKDTYTWNSMVSAYVRNSYFHEAVNCVFDMLASFDARPDFYTFPPGLKACFDIIDGMRMHSWVLKLGLEWDVFVSASLVNMYCRFGRFEMAYGIFKDMPFRDLCCWNAVISGFCQNGCITEALAVFDEMRMEGISLDSFTVSTILPVCAQMNTSLRGKLVHLYVIKHGLEFDTFVSNALINMYASFKELGHAQKVFDLMVCRDLVSWNSIIAAYEQNKHPDDALKFFHEMQMHGVLPDFVTLVSVASGIAQTSDHLCGKSVHGYILRRCWFVKDVVIGNTVVDMYAKIGIVDSARKVFDELPLKDDVSWNTLITGYTQNGLANEAIGIYHNMRVCENIIPNEGTWVSVLPAYAYLGALRKGMETHGQVLKRGFHMDVFVGTCLVDFYAKCGRLDDAMSLFYDVPRTHSIPWNAIISGHAIHGDGLSALQLFRNMIDENVQPDHVTFLSLLAACSHSGLVDEGKRCFNLMEDKYGIKPDLKHYSCMVDLFGRAGDLQTAYTFIKTMPLRPDASIWGALLAACRTHGNVDLGTVASNHLFEVDSDNVGYYVLLSNMYANSGRWEGVGNVRSLVRDKGLRKIPGWSSTELDNVVEVFYTGNRSHPQSVEIYEELAVLTGKIKNLGYTPDYSFVLQDVEDDEKEQILGSHSERLAIVYAMLNTPPKSTIRVYKNLRVCVDCHTVTKLMSKITEREIIVRDANRFHHFKDGACSCGDYW